MNTFKYTITKFDEQLKLLVVAFDDGSWAEIRLVNPLPKNKQDLENIIKQFTPPLEAIQAQLSPDSDVSFINSLVGSEFETDRLVLNPEKIEIDSSANEQVEMWEQVQFEKKLGDALVKFGVLNNNPATIPTVTL